MTTFISIEAVYNSKNSIKGEQKEIKKDTTKMYGQTDKVSYGAYFHYS